MIMKTLLTLSLLLYTLWLIGCNQSAETENNADSATTTVESEEQTDMPAYDPAMDLTLLEGNDIEMLGDTLGIKMYIATMQPGDSVAWHTHPVHSVYVIEGGTLAVYFEGAEKQIMELRDGIGFISPPLSDAAVNTGNTTIKLLTHDIYRPR